MINVRIVHAEPKLGPVVQPRGLHQRGFLIVLADDEGLAIAIATGAPVRVADAVMERLAVPAGTTPIREPGRKRNARPVPRRSNRPRYAPRNMTFADGITGWRFGGSFAEHLSESHWHDYTCVTENGTVVIASAVPEPAGFAMLGQEVYAEDYRGSPVTFRAQFG